MHTYTYATVSFMQSLQSLGGKKESYTKNIPKQGGIYSLCGKEMEEMCFKKRFFHIWLYQFIRQMVRFGAVVVRLTLSFKKNNLTLHPSPKVYTSNIAIDLTSFRTLFSIVLLFFSERQKLHFPHFLLQRFTLFTICYFHDFF